MEDKIRNIVSQYIKIPADQITAQTVIDRSAVASSIILHRMYAQLMNEGIAVVDYTVIKTFGQLSAGLNGNKAAVTFAEPVPQNDYALPAANDTPIGIDVENKSSMPLVNDFREDAFYTMNFAPAEIAYCILQPDPYASFAGLFAAKEAIVKADNLYKNKPFSSIVIDHLTGGKPVYPGFQLSIAHTSDTAYAVAVKNTSFQPAAPVPAAGTGNNSTLTTFTAITAFLLSALTLILFLFKSC
jgi:phosphopantetheinyl transferase (holo-ACP synthase)